MRQKELRIGLVCYGGVSLAVYMHGVTKEVWNLARASRGFHADEANSTGVAAEYRRLLDMLADKHELRLRVIPDIFSGASAGGINAVFLAQAVYSGRSLEPLTELWLNNADIDRLTAEDARMGWRFAKVWAQPLANFVLRYHHGTLCGGVREDGMARGQGRGTRLALESGTLTRRWIGRSCW